MADPIYRLQTLARAEMAVAQVHASRAASRGALFSVGMVFGLLAIGMLTLAGYNFLIPVVGEGVAALIVALVDTVLAVVVLLIARKAGPSENEEQLAREMRDLAYAEIGNDIERVKRDLERISSDVRSIRSGFMSTASTIASGVGPLLGLFAKSAKKKES
jgi:hypothetical protein